ncbi:aminoacyl-tRNA hydrolase, partial [Candidatus Kaiserbacteria bacterium]|nr:aminoacyl-tRNA hydrolase [Candidatus Kaiserbacteria bacterium]
MWYVIGLGNPGDKYAGTRHNIGRDTLLVLRDEGSFGAWEFHKYAMAQSAKGELGGETVELVLPETFMNKSGDTVRYLVEKEGARAGQCVVVYDDVDLPFGEVKVSVGRGAGGHNGVQSIIDALGSREFVRVRIGIAGKSFWTGKVRRPKAGAPLTRHVLGMFSSSEREKLPTLYTEVR